MDFPLELKNLYKHWNSHIQKIHHKNAIEIPQELNWFITERMKIWQKKQHGEKPPFTSDARYSRTN